ncbi:MAG: hypothetical protein DLM57_18945 [Pseudonocardiales bacterium]|nr:MAG: hypothetical protein DLM57_18945 [Pseudonocardiales bacterium]
MSGLRALTSEHLDELAPVLRRAVALDPAGLARVRATEHQVSALVRLPFGVLVSRTLAATAGQTFDVTVRASELLAWLDGAGSAMPTPRDAEWRASLPPARGWQRIDTVPDDVVRGLVRAGAQALTRAADNAGVAGAQQRSEMSDALLDSVVLTVTAASGESSTVVTLRTLSAVTRMGFLPRGSHIAVDVAGRWTRVAAEYGSVYAERAGLGLTLR